MTRPPFRSLVSGFVESCSAHGARPALFVDGETTTYADLGARAQGVADALGEDAGASPVAVLAHRSLAAYTGVLGALLRGSAYVPLNPNFPTERLRQMLDACGADAVVVGEEASGLVADVTAGLDRPLRLIVLGEGAAESLAGSEHDVTVAGAGTVADPQTEPEDIAYVLFTSGSTGAPKGVVVSHRNVRAYLDHVASVYDYGVEDRFSQTFDLTFDLSVHDLFACWDAGACLYVIPQDAVMAPTRFVREHALTAWFSVPSLALSMRRLRVLRAGAFPSLRVSLFCGEALPEAVAEQWQEAAPDSVVDNLYGPTEATIAVTRYRWAEADEERPGGIMPIGEPFDGHRARLVPDVGDAGSGPLPAVGDDADSGELLIAGPQVTPGYLGRPDLTAERFVTFEDEPDVRWYRTGDLARRDADGTLHFAGRIDNQVKVRGYRVELQEVEHALAELVGDGATPVVVAWPVRDGHADGLTAFVVGTPALDAEALIEGCGERLPAYMVPRAVHPIEAFPLNANGKIDRRKLAESLGT